MRRWLVSPGRFLTNMAELRAGVQRHLEQFVREKEGLFLPARALSSHQEEVQSQGAHTTLSGDIMPGKFNHQCVLGKGLREH